MQALRIDNIPKYATLKFCNYAFVVTVSIHKWWFSEFCKIVEWLMNDH
jgi:hypothetical protein